MLNFITYSSNVLQCLYDNKHYFQKRMRERGTDYSLNSISVHNKMVQSFPLIRLAFRVSFIVSKVTFKDLLSELYRLWQ